jgi:hypothetical protein
LPKTLSFYADLERARIALTYSVVVIPTIDLVASDLKRKSTRAGWSDYLSDSCLVKRKGSDKEPWK